MEFVTHFFQALKSPRTALVLAIFSGALLFFPFDSIGLIQPKFTKEYQAQILIIFIFSLAILVSVFIEIFLMLMGTPFRAKATKKQAEDGFYSLNLEELCVLWVMTQNGTKVIKGDYANPVMISLRQKQCLGMLTGPQNLNEAHHYMPDAVYDLVKERGYERFPEDFKNSMKFEDEVREIVHRSTDWRSW